jgi:hypothetical protein
MLQPSTDNSGCLTHFKFEKRALNCHYYLQRASHPTRSLNKIGSRGQEHPKGSKGILRPDFQANNRPRIFFETPMSPQDTGRQLYKFPGEVRLKQFRDNEAQKQKEQESSLMNKKGLRMVLNGRYTVKKVDGMSCL